MLGALTRERPATKFCRLKRKLLAPRELAVPGSGVGAVAEWLRSGLQSRVHRFESGPRLQC